jgi:uncharacterized protein YrrD
MKNKECTLLVHTAHTLEWLKKEGKITDITFDIETKQIEGYIQDKIEGLESELASYKSALKRIAELINQNSKVC